MVSSKKSRASVNARLLFLVFIAASRPAPEARAQEPALFGRWEAIARSYGGIGVTLGIVAGGTLVETIGAIVDGTYRVDGDRVLIREANSPEKAAGSFQVLGDSMVRTSPDGKQRMVLHRVDGRQQGPASIIGRWSYLHPDYGRIAIEEYTPDGQFRFRLPFRYDTQSYTLEGDTLTITTPEAPATPVRWRVSVTDSILTLYPIKGRDTRVFRRIQP